MLLAASGGKCIRFPITAVRVFAGRNSTGVRGVRLAKGDEVISMSIIHHADYEPAERTAYLKRRRLERAEGDDAEDAGIEEIAEENAEEAAANGDDFVLSDERYAEMAEREQFILTMTAKGFGKRTSAYEYRIAGRGGMGIGNIDLGKGKDARNNAVVASFPVVDGSQLVMMTDAGQLIRTDVRDIRIAGRTTRGVTLFRVADDERVVTVTSLDDVADEDDVEGNGQDAADGATAAPAAETTVEDTAPEGAPDGPGDQDDDS